MSKKNILEALEGISDAISSRGSSGGGGFTNVYYSTDVESDLLVCYKNGEYVPFTLMDLVGTTGADDGFKTIPVLIYSDSGLGVVSLPKALISESDSTFYLIFTASVNTVEFVANEENDYQFTIVGGDIPK